MNCAEKYALTSKMNLYAKCLDCQPDEVLIYSWNMFKITNGTEFPVEDFINMTVNGITFYIHSWDTSCPIV